MPLSNTVTGRRTFTNLQAYEIIREYLAGGTSLPALAARHGVCHKTIHKMVTGVTYRQQYIKALNDLSPTASVLSGTGPVQTREPVSEPSLSDLIAQLRQALKTA